GFVEVDVNIFTKSADERARQPIHAAGRLMLEWICAAFVHNLGPTPLSVQPQRPVRLHAGARATPNAPGSMAVTPPGIRRDTGCARHIRSGGRCEPQTLVPAFRGAPL